MMTQTLLSYQYLSEKNESHLTAFAGLPLYLDMARLSGLCVAIEKHLSIKIQGWTDLQILLSLIMLNLAGADCVDDIDRLQADKGLSTLLLSLETQGMKRKERRTYERRWRKTKRRAFPSASVLHRYLEHFHHAEEEAKRVEGRAFIPAPNEFLQSLSRLNNTLLEFAQQKHPCDIATLDQDATLALSHKRTAYYSYEKQKAYQPFNTYWAEQGMLVHSEFRDGNVPASFEQLRLLKASLDVLPAGIKQVYLRSDSAGYQEELLRYCAEGANPRFGVIEFAIAARVSKAFKEAVSEIEENAWHPITKEMQDGSSIKTEQEWAEVCFVPNWTARSKQTPDYRYIAIRERLEMQKELEDIEPVTLDLPFQTIQLKETHYKLFGIVTNRTLPGNALINWHRQRCGDSEKVHSIQKGDLAGGQFPSNKFGANAAWWQIMILAYNLNMLMKQLVLPAALKKKRMKGLRFHLIGLAGRVIWHARRLVIKVSADPTTTAMLQLIRERLFALSQGSPILDTG